MNALRQLSHCAAKRAMKPAPQRLSTSTFHQRFIQRSTSPFNRSQRITLLSRQPRPSFLSSRKFSGVFGASVMGAFLKTSLVFYAIPVTAALSPYVNTLPMDVIYGTILPYHAYVGMHHVLTDYLPVYAWVGTAIAVVMFVGLQNLNIQGEGISPMVRRVFTKQELPTTKEDVQKNNWFKKMQ
eukprot:CAMPEP_0202685306 /NCGR_PEP_ID=MMETSP1385-20130828/1057_1 /ASSEMBLY_ACC=CAM_ASM_000861 /TAXON_ID=933848 /ORGANISM="Elphidium margaritaceum" /LENGTH=182 /DNA_ID=CAMNT_0049339621 /DNA_START=26 /DNA_END=574 /DNA_ORIENTATION=+